MHFINATTIWCIQQYQRILSPLLGTRCRFCPSCSQYALESFSRYSFSRGFNLTFRRLLRCGPWHPGGHDPVP